MRQRGELASMVELVPESQLLKIIRIAVSVEERNETRRAEAARKRQRIAERGRELRRLGVIR